MMNLEFIGFALITLLAVISPGADFAMVTRNALVSSRRAGVLTAIGISLGVLVHVAYAVLGIGLLISQSILAFNILKLLGAAYLLWLGISMLRTPKGSGETEQPKAALGDLDALKTGFLTNLLNPKTTIFIVSVYVQVVDPATTLLAKCGYGAFMSAAHLVWFALVALFFSAGPVRRKLLSVRHWIDRTFGAILTAMGLTLAFSTATGRN